MKTRRSDEFEFDTNTQEVDEVAEGIRRRHRRVIAELARRHALASELGRYTPIVCLLCGCPDMHSDEVSDNGILLLGECPRCDHRFLFRMSDSEAEKPAVAPKRPQRPRYREMPTAA